MVAGAQSVRVSVFECVCTHVICSLIMNLFIRSATGISYYVRQIDSTHDVETELIGYLSATLLSALWRAIE